LRPRSNVTLSVGPSYSHGETGFQYVDRYDDALNTAFYGARYLFGRIVQNTVSMDTRLNVTFSPSLTLELFMQPFIAAGKYTSYSEFAAPRASRRLVYGRDQGTMVLRADANGGPNHVTVDADGAGPAPSFTFDDPSFTFRSLRGNAVLRWEYRPGSTLYLVWTRSGSSSLHRGQLNFGEDFRSLWSGESENIFLVKFNYWLGF
jgi:hypothetical protein